MSLGPSLLGSKHDDQISLNSEVSQLHHVLVVAITRVQSDTRLRSQNSSNIELEATNDHVGSRSEHKNPR